jgi:acetyltransferase-like isoleucine patch superfamily enzyme
MAKISKTAIIYPNVILAEDVVVEDFCVIGLPFEGMLDQETTIDQGGVIRSGTYIYAGNHIGKNFQTGNKANIRELNQIGNGVSIGSLSVVEHHVKIGDNVRIHSQAFVPEYTILEDECWIGPNVVITNARYPKHPNVKNDLIGVHVMKGAKIGANSTLLPGVVVGNNALIGAGSVVTKDVSKCIIAAGSPARQLREIDY